ncbi:MAG: DNA replication/repair protein RecF [Candidatus Microgenomates bacterium]
MFLKTISLFNFRNFTNFQVEFDKNITLIVGKNSRGKTNILESIYFLINGDGFREEKEEELIKIGEKYLEVKGQFLVNDDFLTFSIILKFNENKKIIKKFFIDKSEKNYFSYKKEQIKTVLFSPDQLNIIIDSPQIRRDYFNKLISLFDFQYKKNLNNYEQALKKRNKILEQKANDSQIKDELRFWDEYLVKQGSYIIEKRQQYIDFLNENQEIDSKFFSIKYLKNEINFERLKNCFETDLKYKKTTIGPQKDDFEILIDEKSVHKFGSRSEQRLAIFWLKINEIKYIESIFKIKPIILFDDIFSELDEENQKIIFPLIKNYQIIATSIKPLEDHQAQVIYL